MRRYQRGFIVALLGLLATSFVKVIGKNSPVQKQNGWIKKTSDDLKSGAKSLYQSPSEEQRLPCVLVVGCGHVGQNIVKTIIDNVPHDSMKIFVTDSDKDRAVKLSEYRLSMIKPIKWRYAHDTPDEVDIIVVAVDYDSEDKIIDRLALANKPFITLSDDSNIFDSYYQYEHDFLQSKIKGIIGCGLVPGMADVLIGYASKDIDQILEIKIDRIGFVSSSSLASVKAARRNDPLVVRDGVITRENRLAGSALSWFPDPYNLVQTQCVATGVQVLAQKYPDTHNITVRFAEPRLPTLTDRIRNIFFRIQLPTARAAIRVEVHGIRQGSIVSKIYCISGDAMKMIKSIAFKTIIGFTYRQGETNSAFMTCDDVIDSTELISYLVNNGIDLFEYEGVSS